MKEKLTPIQFVQMNRINLHENLEVLIAEALDLKMPELGTGLLEEAIEKYGAPSKETSLDTETDHQGIHGWLESKLVTNEKRIAYIIKGALEEDKNNLGLIKEVYKEFGYTLGYRMKSQYQINTLEDVYSVVDKVIVDGMPCDKVNTLESSGENELVWLGLKDVHKEHYESLGLSQEIFVTLRESFIKEFLKALGNYSFKLETRPSAPVFRNTITRN